ncbi:hypothetical protein ACX93W_20135 [Paenibacillus sp. CAU 1782]
MNRRKLLKILIALAAVIWLAWNFDGKPGAVPAHDEALTMLKSFAPDVKITEALDVMPLGPKHLFVPFSYEGNNRGSSFIVWERFKWRVARVTTDTTPIIWQSGLSDNSKKAIVWHFAPEQNVAELSFYFLADRNVGYSGGQNIYFPRIQMEQAIPSENISYGVMAFPQEWEHLGKLRKVSYAGWFIRKEKMGEAPSIVESRSIETGKIITRHLRIINESELD